MMINKMENNLRAEFHHHRTLPSEPAAKLVLVPADKAIVGLAVCGQAILTRWFGYLRALAPTFG